MVSVCIDSVPDIIMLCLVIQNLEKSTAIVDYFTLV